LVWTYTIDRRDQEATGLDIVSPVEGSWANPQALVTVFRGVDRVLWSYGNRISNDTATEYAGPVALDRPGKQTVTVAGRSRVDGRWIEKTVTWTNGTASVPIEGWPTSGVRVSGLVVPGAPGYSVSWDDGRSWQSGEAPSNEPSSVTSRKILTLLAKKDGATYRYVYWLDARPPLGALPEFHGGWNPRVAFSGGSEAAHRVIWTRADGKAVAQPGLLWGPVGSWKVPDGMVAARIQIVGTNGLEGPSSSVGFAETGWSTPTWEPWDQKGPQADKSLLPLGGRIVPRPGFWPVYETSDKPDVPEPGTASPLLAQAFLPTLPWGSDRTLYVRFAWRDAGGLTGPASRVVAVRVDRLPPPAPEVLAVGGQVLVKAAEGEEEGGALVWAVTTERVTSAESLTFQPYQGALDVTALRAGAKGRLWFHAQAQDRAGNSGPARLNVALVPAADLESTVVQVDPDPAIGETPVENGGVYPWPAFRLRALDQGRDLWVGVTDQGLGIPDDWKTRVQPWTGILSRGVARGDRRTFQVFWNAKTATGWTWPVPKTLTLTLDLSAPVAPVVSGTWPTAPLGAAWTLNLKPGRPGDSLLYTYTLDGQVPGDPLTSGETWPGTRSWDSAPGERVAVRLRVAAVAVSGVSVEVPLGGAVVIDRSLPAPVTPVLEPFTYSTGEFVVPLPVAGAVVRYTLTSDGRFPEVPSESSPLVPATGLVLPGQDNQSLLYRFRWRSFSLAGLPGQVTDTYGVLVDRSAGPGVVRKTVAAGAKMPLPRLSGLPVGGLSAQPVTLGFDGPEGLVRFEVREGVGAPRPVTPESSLWKTALVLDPGVGVDRSYVVSLRAFSSDGLPLSDEALYPIRIDRAAPAAPVLELVSDPRRPEATLRSPAEGRNPEETLVFRWIWDAFTQGKGEGEWGVYRQNPIVFSAPGGAVTQLRLQAYLRDEAGNLGPTVERNLLIDQNAVYLSVQGTGEGTRSRPLGSVTQALDKARREGKSILLVTAGTYKVPRTLDLGGLRIFGGLSSDLWETTPEPGRTLWAASLPFEGTSFVESSDRSWSLSGIDLATGGVNFAQVVVVRGASVSVKNGSWNWAGSGRGWDQEGGSLDWTNVAISYAAEPNGVLLDWKSLEASARGLRVSATQNQGGVLASLKECVALFQDLVVVSKQARGFDGIWSATQSRLTVDQARIQAGDGADRATAFLLKNTDAGFWNIDISLYGTLANTGFQVTSGHFEVQKGALSLLKGQEFNQGLVLDNASTVLRSFDLKIEAGAYQGGLTMDAGSLKWGASSVRLAGGGQRVWGAQFLTPALVTLDDVSWTLAAKTPGDLWKMEKPWSDGSSVTGGQQTGW